MTKKPSSKKKAFIELTRKGFFLWLFLIFVVSAWMFTLGVLVGRGTAPVDFDIEKLQKELLALKQAVVRKELQKVTSDSGAGLKKTDMGFYEELKESDSKEPPMVAKTPPGNTQARKPKAAKDQPRASNKTVKQTVKPATGKFSTVQEKVAKGAFSIQVASIKDEASADRLVVKLRMKGYPAYQIRAEIPDKGIWYRVRVGPYAKREAAEPVLGRLKNEKLSGFIIKQ